MDRRSDGVIGWWSEHPMVDYAAVLVVTLSHLLLVGLWGRGDVLDGTTIDQRLDLYATGASVAAIIGGVTSVAVALYQSLGGARGGAVRRHYGPEIRRNWRALLIATGLAPTLCLAAMALDRSTGDPLLPRFLFEAALILAAARFLRLMWLFDAFLHIDDVSRTDKPKPPPLDFNPNWSPRPTPPVPSPAGRR